ncbi:MAG: hypothetical protein ACJAZO_004521 [Myxococcota bacterium]|jgi:uncharacterized protein YaeQ
MAISSTVITLTIELADIDRGVYETLELKLAKHPSETGPYFITRAIAYALEYTEGLVFTAGLANGDEPALWVRDLTGALVTWIDIGTPEPNRLHKASKAADNVVVYCHVDTEPWLSRLASESVYKSQDIALHILPRKAISSLADGLERRNTWSLTRTESVLYIESDGESHTLELARIPWPSTP